MLSHSVKLNQANIVQTNSTTAIENVFPEVLRDPILRKVQFATTGRMDDLGMSVVMWSSFRDVANAQQSTKSTTSSSVTSFQVKRSSSCWRTANSSKGSFARRQNFR